MHPHLQLRFLASTSFGRGWYGWADASLTESEAGVDYTGPDGQIATFLAEGGDIAPNPGVEARVDRRPGGLRMRWRWASRFPGMTWEFASDGRLESIADPFGGTTTCAHDEEGRLATLTHQGGRQVALLWEGERVVGLRSSDGRTVTYTYEGDDLVGVERPAGAQTYSVDGAGHILEIVDADGVRLIANAYDDDGRVLAQTTPFGRTTRYAYLAPRTVVVGDDEGGPSTLFRHDVAGRLVELHSANGTVSTRSFDTAGNAVQVVDFDGGTTDRAFDIYGNCVYERLADGSEQQWRYDDAGRVVSHTGPTGAETRYTYEGNAAWPSVIDEPLGQRTTYESVDGLPTQMTDADGVTVEMERDADGMIIALTNALGATVHINPHPSGVPAVVELADGARWTYEVDDAGRLVAEASPLGERRTLTWSSAGRVVTLVAADGSVTSVERGPHGETETLTEPGGVITRGRWDALGNLEVLTGPTGASWKLGYDGLSQMTSLHSPEGARWSLQWGDAGASEGLVDPSGQRWRTEHDALGRTTAEISPSGRRVTVDRQAGGLPVAVHNDAGAALEAVYDALGRPLEFDEDGRPALRWTWTAAGRPSSAVLADGSAWRWRYDRAGRPVEVTNPDGASSAVHYDEVGRVAAVVHPTGARTEQTWDANGRLVEVRDGLAVTSRGYDAVGRLVELRRPGVQPCRFSYDAYGSMATNADAMGATTRWDRDPVTAALAVTDDNGMVRHRRFDSEGRLVAHGDPLGRETTIVRDGFGRQIELVGPDRRPYEFSWDADGRLHSIAVEGHPLFVVDDLESEPGTRVTDASGRVTITAFDARGRQVRSDVDGRVTSVAFDDAAATMAVTSPQGETVTWTVDAQGRPTALEHRLLSHIEVRRDPAGNIIAVEADGFSRRWTRDPWGRVVGYREQVGAEERTFTVERDPAGRVVGEHGPDGSRQYRYDAVGQLVGCTGTAPSGPQRETTWTYDGCGRLMSETVTEAAALAGKRTFTYDDADQIRRVVDGDEVTELDYDVWGRRVTEDGPAGHVTYRWDDLGHLAEVERDGSGGSLSVDPLGVLHAVDGQPVDWVPGGPAGTLPLGLGDGTVVSLPGQPLAVVAGNQVTWVRTDWRGSADDQHDPWGASSGPGDPPAGGEDGVRPRLGYLGEVQLGQLVWLRNRVYDPATHAFLSPDPLQGTLGYPGARTNPYVYANNDPLGWLDPAGAQPLSMAQAQAQMKQWKDNHWAEFAVGTLAIAGAAALIILTAGTATPLIVGAVAGGVLGGGGTVLSDAIQHKPIDWWNVYMNTGVGAFMGAAGGGTAANPSLVDTVVANTPNVLTKPVLLGGAGAVTSFGTSEAANPTLNPTQMLGYGETALTSGVTAGLFSKVSLTNEMVSGKSSAEILALQQSNPAALHSIESSALLGNTVIAPNKTIFQTFANAGLNRLPHPSAPAAPAGVGAGGGQPMSASQLQGYVNANP